MRDFSFGKSMWDVIHCLEKAFLEEISVLLNRSRFRWSCKKFFSRTLERIPDSFRISFLVIPNLARLNTFGSRGDVDVKMHNVVVTYPSRGVQVGDKVLICCQNQVKDTVRTRSCNDISQLAEAVLIDQINEALVGYTMV